MKEGDEDVKTMQRDGGHSTVNLDRSIDVLHGSVSLSDHIIAHT